jgi:hypothetical protein
MSPPPLSPELAFIAGEETMAPPLPLPPPPPGATLHSASPVDALSA